MDDKIMVDTEIFYKLQELIAVRKVNNHSEAQLKVLREDLKPKMEMWGEEIGNRKFQVVPGGAIEVGRVINITLKRSRRKTLSVPRLLEAGIDPEIITQCTEESESVSIMAEVFDPSNVQVMPVEEAT